MEAGSALLQNISTIIRRRPVAGPGEGARGWYRPYEPVLLGFAVEDGDGLAVELAGALVAVPDAYGAELAVLGEGSDQVEHHALLGGAVEVETVVHGDVYEVVGGETLVGQALEVVRGIVVAGLRRGRAVQPVVSVVGPVGQETKDQVRMGRPALAQVDLYGRVLPAIPSPDGDEVLWRNGPEPHAR